MATPQVNTKIERVTEAIEDVAVAVNSGNYENVRNARQELREALAVFLAPVLRVVSEEQ